jgi:hypothetical protein
MKRLLLSCAALSASLFVTSPSALAASLTINDATAPEGSITFNVGQFDTGFGFILDGTTIMSPSEGGASATVSEGTTTPIVHTFSGQFITGGDLVSPTSGTIAFTEAGGGISDILTFSYTGGGPGGVATLSGSFVSDLDPGGTLTAPDGATLVSEGTPFTFNNTNITAAAVSDSTDAATPEPSAFMLFGSGFALVGLALLRRKTAVQN